MASLLLHFNSLLLETGEMPYWAILALEDPQLGVINRFNPKVELWNLYAKSLEGELPEFHPYYVDVRDMIL